MPIIICPARNEKKVTNAAILGSGLIGVGTCEALKLAGIETTVVELTPQLFAFLDGEMAKISGPTERR